MGMFKDKENVVETDKHLVTDYTFKMSVFLEMEISLISE